MSRPKGSKNKGGNGSSTTPPTTEVQQDIFTATPEQLAETYQPPTTNEGESAADYDPDEVFKVTAQGISQAYEQALADAMLQEEVKDSAESSPEANTDTLEQSEGDGSQEALSTPESNVEPIEAIAVEGAITHSLTISGVHLNQVVSELLKAAYCGATLTPKKLPRLSKLPYQVAIQIDDDGYNEYMDSNSGIVYDEQEEYNHLVVSNPDPLKFVQEIMAIGAKGAVIPDRKSCTHIGGRYQVKLATCKAIAPSANVKVKAKKRIYTRDELHAMKMADLKIIAGYYKMTLAGNKAQAVKQLLEKQAEITK